jgi:hypothetical protein
MSSKLYLLYSLFEINYELTNSKKMSHNQITEFYKPFLLFFKNNKKYEKDFINKYIFDIINIISNIDNFVNKNILLFKNNKYYINYECNEYILYKKYICKLNKKYNFMINKLTCINSHNNSIIDSDEEKSKNDSDEENSENNSDEEKSKNESFFYSEIFNSKISNLQEEYYICKSFTYDGYYLLNKELTSCTCKAYEYCKESIKTCKHLDFCLKKNNKELFIINLNKKKCSCNEYLQKKSCKHLEYFEYFE